MSAENTFRTYQIFSEADDATDLINFLKEHKIQYQIESYMPDVELYFGSDNSQKEFRVKILSSQFDYLSGLREEDVKKRLEETGIDETYYLFDFTDDELLEILEKSDEWSPTDYVLAQKILTDRGSKFDLAKIKHLKEKRLEELKQPKKIHVGWLVLGLFFAIGGAFTLFLGFGGVLMGWFFTFSKRTLPNGEQSYSFDETTRKWGKAVFYLSILVLSAMSVFRLLESFKG